MYIVFIYIYIHTCICLVHFYLSIYLSIDLCIYLSYMLIEYAHETKLYTLIRSLLERILQIQINMLCSFLEQISNITPSLKPRELYSPHEPKKNKEGPG